MKRWIIEQWNALRGYRFFWVETPGSPAGGYIDFTPGTCPYPLLKDWSVKACNKAGLCGCNERRDDIGERST